MYQFHGWFGTNTDTDSSDAEDLASAVNAIQAAVAGGAGRGGPRHQSIHSWRRQHLIDTGRLPGLTSSEHAELVAGFGDDIDFDF